MKVKELIENLGKMDPEAVCVCYDSDDGMWYELEDILDSCQRGYVNIKDEYVEPGKKVVLL